MGTALIAAAPADARAVPSATERPSGKPLWRRLRALGTAFIEVVAETERLRREAHRRYPLIGS